MKTWESTLLSPDQSVLTALATMDRSALQIGLVVDGGQRLLGTVTDGDVRRALLAGKDLKSPVSGIMFTGFTSASPGDSDEAVLFAMRKKDLRQIPVVDPEGRVVGLRLLRDMVRPGNRENLVVLMAGGEGARLLPLTENRPKPMLHVAGKPVLQTIIENFAAQGFRRFQVSVNYLGQMIEDHFGDGSALGVSIGYLREDRKLGTGGALGLLPERPDAPFFVMNSDLLTTVGFSKILDFHLANRAQATMCVRQYQFEVPYGVVRAAGHKLSGIDEKPVHRFFVNAGIYVLDPAVLDLVPQNEFLDMPTLFTRLMEKGGECVVFPLCEYWLDIGHREDYERAKGEYPGVLSGTETA
ncbi:MAG: nucleotidyltransferase family protein [Proteobacteria bacterium]|nr:nucleotidyltransferase family protein [Pseudomonadota bacterium]